MRLFAAIAATGVLSALAPAVSAAQAPDPFPTLAEAGLSSVITTVPFDTYAPDTVTVIRSLGLRYYNFDANQHDVVALDAKRADGSAPWCDAYEDPFDPDAQECPLFWTPLISGGGTETAVLGLEDTEPGRSYTFYCSIHRNMVGTIEIAG